MTSDEIEGVATRAARAAVRETLLMLGVDASDSKAIRAMQEDFAYMRNSRLASAMVWSKMYLTVTGLIVTGALGSLWLAFGNRGGH